MNLVLMGVAAISSVASAKVLRKSVSPEKSSFSLIPFIVGGTPNQSDDNI